MWHKGPWFKSLKKTKQQILRNYVCHVFIYMYIYTWISIQCVHQFSTSTHTNSTVGVVACTFKFYSDNISQNSSSPSLMHPICYLYSDLKIDLTVLITLASNLESFFQCANSCCFSRALMRIDMSVMSVDSDTQEVQGLQTIWRKSTVSAGQLVIQGLG